MTFMTFASFSISALLLLSFPLLIPTPLTGYQIFWLLWLILPIMSSSFWSNPAEPGLIKQIPPKIRKVDRNTAIRYLIYWLIDFGLSLIVCTIIFTWTVYGVWHGEDNLIEFKMVFGSSVTSALINSNNYTVAVLYGQNIMLLAMVLFFVSSSIHYLHRRCRIYQLINMIGINYCWIISVITCIIAQAVFLIISVRNELSAWKHVPWGVYIIIVCWPAVLLALQEFIKTRYKKYFEKEQLFAKLEFETRLGMHSPK